MTTRATLLVPLMTRLTSIDGGPVVFIVLDQERHLALTVHPRTGDVHSRDGRIEVDESVGDVLFFHQVRLVDVLCLNLGELHLGLGRAVPALIVQRIVGRAITQIGRVVHHVFTERTESESAHLY